MTVTFEEIIKKYDTNIELNSVSNKLKKTDIFSNLEYTLEDIEKPKHKTDNDGNETYIYNIKDDTKLIVSFTPSNYRTMEVTIEKDSEGEYLPYTWGWNYDGTPWLS